MKTEKVIAQYALTESVYRAAVAAATGPVARQIRVEIPVGDLTPEARLALVDLGRAHETAPSFDLGALTQAPTAEEVSAALVARGEAALLDAARAEADDEDRVWEAEHDDPTQYNNLDYSGTRCPSLMPRIWAWRARYERACAEAELARWEGYVTSQDLAWRELPPAGIGYTGEGIELAGRWAAVRAAAEAAKAEADKAAAVAADLADKAAWIAAHGSERLKLALALGQSLQGYDSERLAAEHPAWEWDKDGVDADAMRQPDLAALKALRAARTEFPEAELATLWPECVNDCPADCGHPRHYVVRAVYRGGNVRVMLHEVYPPSAVHATPAVHVKTCVKCQAVIEIPLLTGSELCPSCGD